MISLAIAGSLAACSSSSGGGGGGSPDGASPTEGGAPGDGGGGGDGAACDPSRLCIQPGCCPLPDQTCGSLTATGNTITDSTTHLTFYRYFLGYKDQTQGAATCAAWGGRIPTEAELMAMVQTYLPCANQVTWESPTPDQCVWTSTQDPANASFYECVYFSSAAPSPGPGTDGLWLVCVK